jgi:hypothetical protein
MNARTRTALIGLNSLLLAGLALAPAAQADSDTTLPGLPDTDWSGPNLCPPYNPEAWVNYCVQLVPTILSVRAYTVDTTPDYTTVCPLPTTCVNVPVILSFVDPATYSVIYYRIYQSVQPSVSQIYEDVCDVIGIACAALEQILAALGSISTGSAGAEMPHGLELEGLGDVGSDGTLDLAFFQAPGGETVALPLV